MADRLVLYLQLTLGAPHLARIRALDAVPGIRCRGLELASAEKTRRFELDAADRALCDTLLEGVYEDLPLARRLTRLCLHLRRVRPWGIIVDSPADPVQLLAGRFCRLVGIRAMTRWAATVFDHPRHAVKEWSKGFVYRGWDAYLSTGSVGEEYLRTFGVPEHRIFRCGNPVDAERIEARRRCFQPERAKSFLFVGRFFELKNLERFVEAYRRYVEGGGSWSFKLVGFGEAEPRLRELARDLSGVEFLGHMQFDALIDRYLGEGCLVLPSYSENWGLVVNEAMHAGMPLLLSRRCGCLPELMEEAANGFALDPYDVEQMAAALHRMEELDAETRSAFSRRSLEIIEGHTPAVWASRVAMAMDAIAGVE